MISSPMFYNRHTAMTSFSCSEYTLVFRKYQIFTKTKTKMHAQSFHGQIFFTGTVYFQKITRKQKTFTECLNFIQIIYKLYLHLKKYGKEISVYNTFALDYQYLTLKTNNQTNDNRDRDQDMQICKHTDI